MHKSHQILHKPFAHPDDILKLINHKHFFAAAPAGDLHKNIMKRGKRLDIIAVLRKLAPPLIHLLPLGTCLCQIVEAGFILHKFPNQRRLADMLLPVYDKNLTAFSVVIIIQIP